MIIVKWELEVNELMRTVVAQGFCERSSTLVERIMLTDAVNIFQMARRFGGVIILQANFPNNNSPISIRFEVIFRTQRRMYEFLKEVKEST